jgi:hypothetical protein
MASEEESESIYELWERVREHPDFLFGQLYGKDDFEKVSENFKYDVGNRANEWLHASAIEFTELEYGDGMPHETL